MARGVVVSITASEVRVALRDHARLPLTRSHGRVHGRRAVQIDVCAELWHLVLHICFALSSYKLTQWYVCSFRSLLAYMTIGWA